MKPCRIALAAATLALAGAAFAQAPAESSRSAAEPPDGSRPADGAIKGGSIVPGESGGMPNASPGTGPAQRSQRCNELSGTLRDDCLLKEQSSGTGASRAPAGAGAPPPQNPR